MTVLTRITEIARDIRHPGGDDIPAGAAIADVIDRAELPREVEGLGICARPRRDQPDPLGCDGERRQ